MDQVVTNTAMALVISCKPVSCVIWMYVYIHALNGMSSFCLLSKAPGCTQCKGSKEAQESKAGSWETAHLLVQGLLPWDVGLLGRQRRILAGKGGHEILWEVRWSPILSNL